MSINNTPTVHLSQIHSLVGDNTSRCDNQPLFADDSDKRRLANKMLAGFNVAVGTMGITPMTDDEIATAVAEREATWTELQAATEKFEITESLTNKKVTVSASDYLRAWENVNTKKGKIIAPKYAVVWGHRRYNVMVLCAAVRFSLGLDDTPIVEIPAVIRQYENHGDRALDALRENENKKDGFRELSWADKVHGARIMFRDALSEARFREVWAVGTAQKLFAFCRLDQQYPDLGLYNRVMTSDLDPSKLDKEELRKLANPKEVEVTAEMVESFLNDPTNTKTKVAMTSKKDLKAISEQSPIRFVCDYTAAILANEAQVFLRQYNVKCDAINAAIKAAMAE